MDTLPNCRMSDPAQPHKLCLRSSHHPFSICFSCKGKHLGDNEDYFYCDTCDLEFHVACHLLPPEIKHPFHPSHPLTRILLPTFDISMLYRCWTSELSSYSSYEVWMHISYNFPPPADDDDDDDDGGGRGDDDDDISLLDGYHKCKCCQRGLDDAYYHCSICNFNLNVDCSLQRPYTMILRFKSHKHPFNLFPIRLSSPCDACGLSLDDTKDLVYTCLPCSHMIHKSCIYLPRVIKITRHRHRLSFASSLLPGDLFCGVCRKRVDSNYGRYSCHTGCQYAVHSKCATRKDVWDGKDLEGVPEEPEEDIEPFVRIDDETIQHFSHHKHYLKLQEKKDIIHEKDKFCEACTLPIKIFQRFYGCKQCDFVLDEACAALPRKKYLPLHKHPLTLIPFPIGVTPVSVIRISAEGIFNCDGCGLDSCGFQYKCGEEDCGFQLDVRCAALPDPIIHGCHPQDHPLFFNLTQGKCMGCGGGVFCSSYFLECIKCESFLGLKCASLPSVAHYKHDRHPLSLCYGQENTTSGQYWCEKCEGRLDSKKWFYTCETCRITLHVRCLLGKDIYMKPNHIMKLSDYEVEISLNDGNSRVVCCQCHRRCEDIFVFKMVDIDRNYCTFYCLGTYITILVVGWR